MAREDKVYRVLDANQNRLREALRVVEDICRFVLSSSKLAMSYKVLRHQVTRQLLKLPIKYRSVVSSRDSEGDVGRESFISVKEKENLEDLAIRNLKRAEEAARVLEEFLKIVDKKVAVQFQKIRFEIYELERKTLKKF